MKIETVYLSIEIVFMKVDKIVFVLKAQYLYKIIKDIHKCLKLKVYNIKLNFRFR